MANQALPRQLLPAPLNYTDRREPVAAIMEAARAAAGAGSATLLVICGAQGTGKTGTAVHAPYQAAGLFRGGQALAPKTWPLSTRITPSWACRPWMSARHDAIEHLINQVPGGTVDQSGQRRSSHAPAPQATNRPVSRWPRPRGPRWRIRRHRGPG